jgi:hypothetical protein
MELKMRHRPTSEARGVAQLANYLESLGLTEGWLVLFDPSRGDDWDARIFTRTEVVGTRRVHLVGC